MKCDPFASYLLSIESENFAEELWLLKFVKSFPKEMNGMWELSDDRAVAHNKKELKNLQDYECKRLTISTIGF